MTLRAWIVPVRHLSNVAGRAPPDRTMTTGPGEMDTGLQNIGLQVAWLFVLAIPIACIAWTITHEEVFREPREFCVEQSRNCRRLIQRKFFYLFTCEYCFSHYVTIFFLILTRYKLLFDDWRGYLIGGFALVWVANQYMSIFGRLRLDIKSERVEIAAKEEIKERVKNSEPVPHDGSASRERASALKQAAP